MLRWAKEVLPGAVKPAVATRYLASIGQLDAIFGALRMDQITPQTVAAYVSARTGKVTNATIRRDLTALSRLMAACVSWGWRTDNPASAYDRSMVREKRDPITLPGDREWHLLLAEAPEEIRRILRLLDATGFRSKEGEDLRGEQVDKARGQITLSITKTMRRRVVNWRTPGGDATPLLADAPRTGRLFRAYPNFSSNVGQVMRRIERQEQKAGREFRRFRVHDLRHRFAVRWLKEGGNIYSLSNHLGHTSVKTTEIYLDHLTEQERGVAQKGTQTAPERVESPSAKGDLEDAD
ncbi:tyrosine-type recombinase/integrase [Pararoseomonas indoligenes]|uniref:tyrosine-type recombinase/integrase n=1 Tax=Roseomonas indoligenes TaxID=2820811 RepID=UPI0031591C89